MCICLKNDSVAPPPWKHVACALGENARGHFICSIAGHLQSSGWIFLPVQQRPGITSAAHRHVSLMVRFPRVFPKAMPCSAQARQHAGDCSRVPCDECPCEHRGCPFKCLQGNGRPPLEHSREPTPHGQQPFRVLDRFPSTSPSQRRSGAGEGGEGGRWKGRRGWGELWEDGVGVEEEEEGGGGGKSRIEMKTIKTVLPAFPGLRPFPRWPAHTWLPELDPVFLPVGPEGELLGRLLCCGVCPPNLSKPRCSRLSFLHTRWAPNHAFSKTNMLLSI